jgi:hypothetical protein
MRLRKKRRSTLSRVVPFLFLTGGCFFIIPRPISAQELCTDDIIQNADFEAGNTGIPYFWNTRGDYENRGVDVENGALKLWVGEGGNFETGTKTWLFLGQEPNKQAFSQIFAKDTLYVRAKVKSTAIDVPTDEELLARFREEKPGKDTAGANYNENVGSQGGFQVALQQANMPGSPPWFIPMKWTPVTNHDGSAIDEWKWLSGHAVLESMANYIGVWILLNSKSACTVWIDSIQISSSPDFCVGAVSIKPRVSLKNNDRNITIRNNRIVFGNVSHYSVNIFHPNGSQCSTLSGYADEIDIHSFSLPAGAYIFKIHSDAGDVTRPIVIQKK